MAYITNNTGGVIPPSGGIYLNGGYGSWREIEEKHLHIQYIGEPASCTDINIRHRFTDQNSDI
jgi:hypothetical protein